MENIDLTRLDYVRKHEDDSTLLVVEKEPLKEFYFQVRELTVFSVGLVKSVRRLTVGNLFLLVLSAIQSSIIIYLTW